MKRIAALTFGLLASCAWAQQPTPEQTIQMQAQTVQRLNACIDAYGSWIAALQRLEAAAQQIEALKKQVAEQKPLPKRPDEDMKK